MPARKPCKGPRSIAWSREGGAGATPQPWAGRLRSRSPPTLKTKTLLPIRIPSAASYLSSCCFCAETPTAAHTWEK